MHIKSACFKQINNPWELWIVKQTKHRTEYYEVVPVSNLEDHGIKLIVQLVEISQISLAFYPYIDIEDGLEVAMTVPDESGNLFMQFFSDPKTWKYEINGFLEANTDLIPVLCKPGLDWKTFHGFEKYLVHRMGAAFIKTEDRIFLCQLGGTVRVMLTHEALEALKGFSTVRWGDSCLEAFIHAPEVGRNTPR